MPGSVRMPGGATTLGAPVWAAATRSKLPCGRTVRVGGTTIVDVVAPTTLFISETVAKVSLTSGFTDTVVSWSANEDCQAWQIRDVTGAAGQTIADGVLVASGAAITAGVTQTTTVSGSALTAGDGVKTLKLFAQDLAGNWTA
jgi:hypothetical protein